MQVISRWTWPRALLTPGKVGEFTRTFYLPYDNNFKVISLVILDRYIDSVSLLFISSVGISHFIGLYFGIGVVIFGIALFLHSFLPSIIKGEVIKKS